MSFSTDHCPFVDYSVATCVLRPVTCKANYVKHTYYDFVKNDNQHNMQTRQCDELYQKAQHVTWDLAGAPRLTGVSFMFQSAFQNVKKIPSEMGVAPLHNPFDP